MNTREEYNNKNDLSWAINRLCEFHQYPVGTDNERMAIEIILKELGKENPCKNNFYKKNIWGIRNRNIGSSDDN